MAFEFWAELQPDDIEIDAETRAGWLRHDGSPVLEWRLGNVVGKADSRIRMGS